MKTPKNRKSTGRSSHSAIIHNPHYEITTPSGHGDRQVYQQIRRGEEKGRIVNM